MIDLYQKTAPQIAAEVAQRVRQRRKEKKLTQEDLAQRAGLSLGSYKRFEQSYQISFDSLIKIAIALDAEEDFKILFSKRHFASLQELIDEENFTT